MDTATAKEQDEHARYCYKAVAAVSHEASGSATMDQHSSPAFLLPALLLPALLILPPNIYYSPSICYGGPSWWHCSPHCTALHCWPLETVFLGGWGGKRNSKNGDVSEVIGGGFQKQIIRGQGGVNKNRKCFFLLG